MCFLFFFSSRRRHTRSYGDWSSDVCSSDLEAGFKAILAKDPKNAPALFGRGLVAALAGDKAGLRSEERRVGKECRCRWLPYQLNKNDKHTRCRRLTTLVTHI